MTLYIHIRAYMCMFVIAEQNQKRQTATLDAEMHITRIRQVMEPEIIAKHRSNNKGKF